MVATVMPCWRVVQSGRWSNGHIVVKKIKLQHGTLVREFGLLWDQRGPCIPHNVFLHLTIVSPAGGENTVSHATKRCVLGTVCFVQC